MNMNERKIHILEAIIRDYIQTGDPVGSRTLSKKYNLGVSSATIRNEMADLEELGLILQPHTSAGRIPSDRGYRLYVDELMQRTQINQDVEQVIHTMIKQRIHRIDKLVEETAHLISMLTNCATITSTPSITQTKLKHLQLVPVDNTRVACVIVTDTNLVKNHIICTPTPLDFNTCLVLTTLLNDSLKETTLSELKQEGFRVTLEGTMQKYQHLATQVLQAIHQTLQEQDMPDIYIRGVTNFLDEQAFNDQDRVKDIIKILEEKPYLVELLDSTGRPGITIRIGEENTLHEMKDCSVVTTSYALGEYTLGNIGIIGPTRMNYSQVVSILEYITNYISMMLLQMK